MLALAGYFIPPFFAYLTFFCDMPPPPPPPADFLYGDLPVIAAMGKILVTPLQNSW